MEIGFPVGKAIPGRDEVLASQVPGGKLGYALHTGRYSDIAPAYDALAQFIREQGYVPTGVSYEFYLNDPTETPQEQLQTQIVFPLK